jgi:hypothetical protein
MPKRNAPARNILVILGLLVVFGLVLSIADHFWRSPKVVDTRLPVQPASVLPAGGEPARSGGPEAR